MTTSLSATKKLTFAFCTYNRADRLEKLVTAMRAQSCPIPFEILAVNNNSQDNALDILQRLAKQSGAPLRFVTEIDQGIVAARNRAIEESMNSDILVFIDDDEMPMPGLLAAASNAILNEGAQCAGGCVQVDFSHYPRPSWLDDELLGFLAATDYGRESFWIKDATTPIWTANIAYDMNLFRDDSGLRFDKRYNRKGKGVDGGEDVMMFRELLARKTRIQYTPDMVVLHDVETWRLHRSYFIKLHYHSGLRKSKNEHQEYSRTVFGIPPFMITQLIKHCLKTVKMYLNFDSGALRQAMNMSHAFGMIYGYFLTKTMKNIS